MGGVSGVVWGGGCAEGGGRIGFVIGGKRYWGFL